MIDDNTKDIIKIAIIPLVISLTGIFINYYLTKRLKDKKDKTWINFLKFDIYISDCIQEFKKIESLELKKILITQTSGILFGFLVYICFLISLIIFFGKNWLPFAVSTLIIFLFAFLLTIAISMHMDRRKKNQELLKYSEKITKDTLFVNWIIVSGVFFAIFYPYNLIKTEPINSDTISIFGLSFIFLILALTSLFDIRRKLLKSSKFLLISEHFEDFPRVNVKTTSADFYGKIYDVFDENLIILDDNGVKKAAEWHSITYLELKKNEEPKESKTDEKDIIAHIETTNLSSKLKNWFHNSINWVLSFKNKINIGSVRGEKSKSQK